MLEERYENGGGDDNDYDVDDDGAYPYARQRGFYESLVSKLTASKVRQSGLQARREQLEDELAFLQFEIECVESEVQESRESQLFVDSKEQEIVEEFERLTSTTASSGRPEDTNILLKKLVAVGRDVFNILHRDVTIGEAGHKQLELALARIEAMLAERVVERNSLQARVLELQRICEDRVADRQRLHDQNIQLECRLDTFQADVGLLTERRNSLQNQIHSIRTAINERTRLSRGHLLASLNDAAQVITSDEDSSEIMLIAESDENLIAIPSEQIPSSSSASPPEYQSGTTSYDCHHNSFSTGISKSRSASTGVSKPLSTSSLTHSTKDGKDVIIVEGSGRIMPKKEVFYECPASLSGSSSSLDSDWSSQFFADSKEQEIVEQFEPLTSTTVSTGISKPLSSSSLTHSTKDGKDVVIVEGSGRILPKKEIFYECPPSLSGSSAFLDSDSSHTHSNKDGKDVVIVEGSGRILPKKEVFYECPDSLSGSSSSDSSFFLNSATTAADRLPSSLFDASSSSSDEETGTLETELTLPQNDESVWSLADDNFPDNGRASSSSSDASFITAKTNRSSTSSLYSSNRSKDLRFDSIVQQLKSIHVSPRLNEPEPDNSALVNADPIVEVPYGDNGNDRADDDDDNYNVEVWREIEENVTKFDEDSSKSPSSPSND